MDENGGEIYVFDGYGKNLQETAIRLLKKKGKPEIFAKNLRFLTALKGLNAASLAQKVQAMLLATGSYLEDDEDTKISPNLIKKSLAKFEKDPVDPRWIRRLLREGVSKASPRTYQHLHALALFFGVNIDSFWDEALVQKMNFEWAMHHDETRPDFESLHVRKFAELMTIEKYQYLKSLIDSLFDEMTKEKRLKEKKAKARK